MSLHSFRTKPLFVWVKKWTQSPPPADSEAIELSSMITSYVDDEFNNFAASMGNKIDTAVAKSIDDQMALRCPDPVVDKLDPTEMEILQHEAAKSALLNVAVKDILQADRHKHLLHNMSVADVLTKILQRQDKQYDEILALEKELQSIRELQQHMLADDLENLTAANQEFFF